MFTLQTNSTFCRILLTVELGVGHIRSLTNKYRLSRVMQLFDAALIRGQARKGWNPFKIGIILFLFLPPVFRIIAVLSLWCCRFL